MCGHHLYKNKNMTWKVAFVVFCSGNHNVKSDLAQKQADQVNVPLNLYSLEQGLKDTELYEGSGVMGNF